MLFVPTDGHVDSTCADSLDHREDFLARQSEHRVDSHSGERFGSDVVSWAS
jgi:hypothetical protein